MWCHLPGAIEFLILLGQTAVNLLTNGTELELGTSCLGLGLLKSTLSLLESCLELFLLLLETTTCFVDLVNVASAFSELVGEVVDLI